MVSLEKEKPMILGPSVLLWIWISLEMAFKPIEMVTGYKKKEWSSGNQIDHQKVDMDLFTEKQELFVCI